MTINDIQAILYMKMPTISDIQTISWTAWPSSIFLYTLYRGGSGSCHITQQLCDR